MKQVDELIRGELSAVQSIDAVLKKIKDQSEVRELTSIRADHVRAVDTLKRYGSGSFDQKSTQGAGPWGAFASAFAGGASFFGDKAAIQALKVGEEHGIQEYQEFLEDQQSDPALVQVIRNELIPQQKKHLEMINRFLQ